MGFPRVGAVNCLAVVAKGLLDEACRVAAGLGAFRPDVAVAVQRDALNHQTAAGAGKFGRPVRLAHGLQIWKERPRLRKRFQEHLKLLAKADVPFARLRILNQARASRFSAIKSIELMPIAR